MMTTIRPFQPDDLEDLYEVCLKTGDSGQDASHLHADHRLVGHIYAAPYGVLAPECCFVAEDRAGVAGYIVGAADTNGFAARCEEEWWPALRRSYPAPRGVPTPDWDLDRMRSWQIHHPYFAPRRVIELYPSHLHINLLPRLQGRDVGRRLIQRWIEAMRAMGSPGLHFGVSHSNTRALRFYRLFGFEELVLPGRGPADGHWFAMTL
jgi:ribosomal protein S18 acetylase RimI-like enzyme